MNIKIHDQKMPFPELHKDSPIYKNRDKKVVDAVIREYCNSIPHMVEGRPYTAQFILWNLWKNRPKSHHCTLGSILSEVVQLYPSPLDAVPGEVYGSALVVYFLNESKLKCILINQSLKNPKEK